MRIKLTGILSIETGCCQSWSPGAKNLLGSLNRYRIDFVSLGLEASLVQSDIKVEGVVAGKSRKLIWFIICAALLLGLALWKRQSGGPAGSSTQWPTKNITLIYHTKAGSGGDIFLRSLGIPMERELGQSVVVDNKPGAGGMNAWKRATRARDSHTFLGVSSTIITTPILNRTDLNYKSFAPVAMLFVDPMVLFVGSGSPWKTFEDFVADAKKNPGQYNIGCGIPGELAFVAGILLEKEAGIEINIVPYESGADAAISVLGAHIDGAIGEYAEAAGQIEGGDLKILIGFNPVPGLKIRTVKDAGLHIEIEKFRGLLTPQDTPQEVIDRLVEVCRKALEDPAFIEYYENMKLVPSLKTGSAFAEVMSLQDGQISVR